jgi:serine protease inhibitor
MCYYISFGSKVFNIFHFINKGNTKKICMFDKTFIYNTTIMKMKKLYLLFIPLVFLSCGSDDSDELIVCPSPDPVKINWTRSETELIGKNTDFGIKMFTQLCSKAGNKNGNVTFSPLSMEYLLGMIANGASDDARKEMLTAMNYGEANIQSVNSMYEKMTKMLYQSDTNVQLKLANSAWVRNDFAIHQAYKDTLNKVFFAPITNINFKNTSEAQNIINKWCDKYTNGLIKKTSLEVQESMKMVLANATYFKGTWKNKFDEKKTAKDDFTCADGSVEKVDMMNRTGDIAYAATDDYQMVVLPYGNGAFSMTLILPKEGKDIDKIASAIDWTKTDTASTNLSLYVPKFKKESHWADFDTTLMELGILKIFKDGNPLAEIANNLCVSVITQDVCIDVNESGTEAAAVSTGGMVTSSNPNLGSEKLKFNRPFLFSIKEHSTGATLFIGKISKI